MKTRRPGLTVIALAAAIAAALGRREVVPKFPRRAFRQPESWHDPEGETSRSDQRADRPVGRAGQNEDTTCASRWIPAGLARLPR